MAVLIARNVTTIRPLPINFLKHTCGWEGHFHYSIITFEAFKGIIYPGTTIETCLMWTKLTYPSFKLLN